MLSCMVAVCMLLGMYIDLLRAAHVAHGLTVGPVTVAGSPQQQLAVCVTDHAVGCCSPGLLLSDSVALHTLCADGDRSGLGGVVDRSIEHLLAYAECAGESRVSLDTLQVYGQQVAAVPLCASPLWQLVQPLNQCNYSMPYNNSACALAHWNFTITRVPVSLHMRQ